MPIDTEHPDFTKYTEKWKRLRDTYEGGDEVKAGGEKYLPRLADQKDPDYQAYKTRALYFDGLEKTVKGLIGAVMRIEPIIEAPKSMLNLFSDITNTGTSLNSLISIMLKEQLLLSRQGLLVDFNKVLNRPYLIHYSTEQITNWFNDTVVLREAYRVDVDDKYKIEYKTQYRELTLVDDVYTTAIWRKEKDIWVQQTPIIAENKGSPLDYIPFVGTSIDGFNLDPSKSPMLPLADVALSLYRTSADLEHGRHFVALPTPYATNIDPAQSGTKLSIGPSKVWLLPEGSQPGILEFKGQGLKALEVAMSEKLGMMLALGSQLLQAPKAGVESAETVRLKQNAEASTLVNAVKMVEQSITRALMYMGEWIGVSDNSISVKLNTDFVSARMNSQDLKALMDTYLSGSISQDTFLQNLKEGEILHSDVSIEEEKDKIELESSDLDGDS